MIGRTDDLPLRARAMTDGAEHAAQAADAPRVAIVGGGVAGLETLLALAHLAPGSMAITLVEPEPDFSYKPLAVEEPFTHEPPEHRALEPLADEFGVRLLPRRLARADPDEHLLELDDGSSLAYDVAVICAGARVSPAFANGITFAAPSDRRRLATLLRDAAGEDGPPRRFAFVVPPSNGWPLPIYELALMAQRRAIELGVRDARFTIVTPEPAPLAVFGTVASDAVAEILGARGIEVRAGARAREDEHGRLVLTPGGEPLEATDVIALPAQEGPGIPGLPADERGFIPIDEHARVRGTEDVYAAGDGTSFPLKQGGLATQQADAAAEHIAARFGADVDPAPFRPVLRGLLITGGESLSLHHSLAGGGGEGVASADCLWWPPHKVSGRYLAPWLATTGMHREPEPPGRPLEVEVELPAEWHGEPMALDPHRWHQL